MIQETPQKANRAGNCGKSKFSYRTSMGPEGPKQLKRKKERKKSLITRPNIKG